MNFRLPHLSISPSRRALPALLAAVLAVCCLAGCATTQVPSLTESGGDYAVAEDERKLIEQSNRFEAELRDEGLLVRDPELQEYVDGVAAKLIPAGLPEQLDFHVRVLREPTINAFALPQGGIYLHAGLLARLENEAQLAHVLAHEISHTLHRHQLEHLHSLQNKTVAAKVAQLVLVPAAVLVGGGAGGDLMNGLVGLTYAAAVTGYGREKEQEADLEGLRLVAAAGYDVDEAHEIFELTTEIEEPGALEGFFYSNHPSNEARERYTRELIESGAVASAGEGVTNAEAYQEATRRITLENIRLRLRRRHYEYALREIERARERRGEDPEILYYAAEAHRRRAEDPEGAAREQAMRQRKQPDASLVKRFEDRAELERKTAVSCYRRVLELDASLAGAHRGLGLIALEAGEEETARGELEHYLQLDSAPRDRRYIERILEEMTR